MAITRNIEIDGRQVLFKASAAIPRIYRARFGRDIFKDLEHLMGAIEQRTGDDSTVQDGIQLSTLDTFTLEIFENIAYTMAKYADPTVPETAEEWLDGFGTFSIYQVMPQLIELWGLNAQTDADSKKN